MPFATPADRDAPVSWTVLDDDGDPVEPVEQYLARLARLACLAGLQRSPNTLRAYATRLRLWLEFLGQVGVGWSAAGGFVSWLRAPADNVVPLEGATANFSPATVNRHLAAAFDFYDHYARLGGGDGRRADGLGAGGSGGSTTALLHQVTKARPIPTPPVKLVVPHRAPRTLSAEDVAAIMAACERLCDRFLCRCLRSATASIRGRVPR